MNIVLFTLYTLLGSSLWITPLAGFGYWLGGNWMDVLAWLDYYENAVLILLALIIAYYLYRRRRGSQLPGRKHIRSLW
jgi:membrane protein DedA with SNARE-associated domain